MTAKIDFIKADEAKKISNNNETAELGFFDAHRNVISEIDASIRGNSELGARKTWVEFTDEDLTTISDAETLTDFLRDCGYKVKVDVVFHESHKRKSGFGYDNVDFKKDIGGSYLSEADDYPYMTFDFHISWK